MEKCFEILDNLESRPYFTAEKLEMGKSFLYKNFILPEYKKIING